MQSTLSSVVHPLNTETTNNLLGVMKTSFLQLESCFKKKIGAALDRSSRLVRRLEDSLVARLLPLEESYAICPLLKWWLLLVMTLPLPLLPPAMTLMACCVHMMWLPRLG